MRIKYAPRAIGDIKDIGRYLLPLDAKAAANVGPSIRSTIRGVAEFPLSGRLQDDGSRKAVALPYGYLIYYDVGDEMIEIVTIQHPSRARQPSDK